MSDNPTSSADDTIDPRVREMLDRQQISDVVSRYCRAIDRRDFALLRTCYHPGAVDRHTGFHGDIDDYVAWLERVLTVYPHTQHLTGQQLIEIDGDVARCETYGQATHWTGADGDAERDFTSGFRYIDRMERREGEWRIADRIAVRDWTRRDTGRLIAKSSPGPVGVAGADDPLYHLPGWPPGTAQTLPPTRR